jgi:hypothetical protein
MTKTYRPGRPWYPPAMRGLTCASCSSPVPERSRYCPSCGAALDTSSRVPTVLARAAGASPVSSDSISEGRFVPGTIFAGRYRVLGLLGKGGMGEVYRADDLSLGQAVALKFLPEALAADSYRLARLLGEVRIARAARGAGGDGPQRHLLAGARPVPDVPRKAGLPPGGLDRARGPRPDLGSLQDLSHRPPRQAGGGADRSRAGGGPEARARDAGGRRGVGLRRG